MFVYDGLTVSCEHDVLGMHVCAPCLHLSLQSARVCLRTCTDICHSHCDVEGSSIFESCFDVMSLIMIDL